MPRESADSYQPDLSLDAKAEEGIFSMTRAEMIRHVDQENF